MHALTLLAHDAVAQNAWFWNGFGLAVVDAVRKIEAFQVKPPAGFKFRPASITDGEILSVLDTEHWRHYPAPPVLMVPQLPGDAAEISAFIDQPDAGFWMAWQDDHPAGFIRFERSGDGAAAAVQSEDTIAITGAYIRPDYRGM